MMGNLKRQFLIKISNSGFYIEEIILIGIICKVFMKRLKKVFETIF